ncbi:hypothetical protein ACMDCT_15800 [Halomonadaceae bacterium KBTZ08]
MLGQIFTKAQNKIQDPAKLARLIDMIDAENWVMLDAEVKGDISKTCWSATPRAPSPAPGSNYSAPADWRHGR